MTKVSQTQSNILRTNCQEQKCREQSVTNKSVTNKSATNKSATNEYTVITPWVKYETPRGESKILTS